MRWSQVAFTDDDPRRFDPQFWFDYWKRIHADGTCLSAGGVTAYYPTKVPFHARSPYLGDRDIFGDMVKGARALNMKVLARVDPHAMRADALAAHPEWVARAPDGSPRKHPSAPDLFLTCGNGAVNFEFMPQVIDEIMRAYDPDAIFGNRWAGSAGVCYCESCRTQFRKASGFEIPPANSDPLSPERKAYLVWDEEVRFAQIKLWDERIQKISPRAFFSPGTIARLDPARLRTTIRAIYADRQGRVGAQPAWSNGKSAKETRAVMRDKPMAGIFTIGIEDGHRWKDSVQGQAEILSYVHDGLAQGFRPWVTKFKAETFDTRWMPTVEKVYNWHWKNERYFRNTENLARVAIVQSAASATYYGRNPQSAVTDGVGMADRGSSVADAQNGFYQALVEAKIPFEMVDDRELSPDAIDRFRVLVLPNIAALSDKQCEQLRSYVQRGGRLVATHETSLYDEWGAPRANFGLADLFGCDYAGKVLERVQNSYLTLRGPHPLLRGLEDAPRVIAGAAQVQIRPTDRARQPLTLVPSYPDLPMERVFTQQWTTDQPAVFARQVGRGRVVYFPMDIDRTFWEVGTEDHLKLLRNAVEWAVDEPHPMAVQGAGLLDVALWRQEGSMAAHLVNLQNPMTMRGFYRDYIPVGPFTVTLALPPGARVKGVRLLEADQAVQARQENGRLIVEVPRVQVHEVVAVDFA
ncbi:MAG: hypothetical protein BGN86_05130 [Caulobacterales bacterium 68-7]|nr:MAG: hypothetical protein BGN86_05130 [Caulobacterales bacterium 68-7]